MTLPVILEDLPWYCDVRIKRNAKGHQESWIGYELHVGSADGDIPISCVLTAASVHDSQVAIPLAESTPAALGHVPIIDINPCVTPGLKQELAD